MLFKDTKYKVLRYLAKLSNERVLPIEYKDENYMRHLIDRKAIQPIGKQFSVTKKFDENFLEDVFGECLIFHEEVDGRVDFLLIAVK